MIEALEDEEEEDAEEALAMWAGLAVVARQRMEFAERTEVLWRARRKAACMRYFENKAEKER